MNPDNYGLVEMIFVLALALGFGGWQLWSVNRDIAKDKAKKSAEEAKSDSHPHSVRPE